MELGYLEMLQIYDLSSEVQAFELNNLYKLLQLRISSKGQIAVNRFQCLFFSSLSCLFYDHKSAFSYAKRKRNIRKIEISSYQPLAFIMNMLVGGKTTLMNCV